jgi:hypothetical protein
MPSPSPLLVTSVAGEHGTWSIEAMTAPRGESLPSAARIAVHEGGSVALAHDGVWALRGTTSNTRYTNRAEVTDFSARQQGLLRPEATCAALIPIRKSEAWWTLAQDERRALFEEQSQHIAIGMEYLPPIARRLHHCREGGVLIPTKPMFDSLQSIALTHGLLQYDKHDYMSES